ncbi:MAG: S41 family peptidase [Bacteroidota bacterium]
MKPARLYQFRILLVYAVFAFFTSFTFCKAQGNAYNPDDKYTVEQLKTDFTYFRAVLEKAHPSLYRYLPKDSADVYFNKVLAQITQPMTELAFWELLQPTLSRLGSGHTSLSLSTAAFNYHNSYAHHYLPFYIFIRNNRIFIRTYTTLSNVSFDIGDEVLAIDNKSSAQILQKLRSLIAGDGYTNCFKDSQLEGEYFTRIFSLVYGEQQQYTITFNAAGVIKDKTLNSASVRYWAAPKTAERGFSVSNGFNAFTNTGPVKPDSFYHKLTFPVNLPSTAVLKIIGFKYQDYESFHRKVFKQLKKNQTQNLVIDLRDNNGGTDEICRDLLSYLSGNKTQLVSFCEGFVNFDRFVSLVSQYSPINLSEIEHSFYQIKTSVSAMQSPDANHFKGKLFILTNGGTYSAAALLAVAIKNQVDCTVIGQETGGGLAGTDGMRIPIVELPETRLRLSLPLLWGYSMYKEKNEGHGLMPDIELIPNAQQILDLEARGIDPLLLKVRALIGVK